MSIYSAIVDRLYGPSINPAERETFKFFPNNPPRKHERVLVDGRRCTVTRVRVTWQGREWTLRDLRVKFLDVAPACRPSVGEAMTPDQEKRRSA